MNIRVRYFAAIRDLVGMEGEILHVDSADAKGLRSALLSQYPKLEAYLPYIRFALDDRFLDDDESFADDAEISLIPPVAGGDHRLAIKVHTEVLSVDRCIDFVRDPSAGGICVFIGVVRNRSRGQQVERLEYEAHPTMALAELERVVDEVAADDTTLRIAVEHRFGDLKVGDLAVVVAASAPHRDAAFIACRKTIDTLKKRVPIWKREHGEHSTEWVNFAQ